MRRRRRRQLPVLRLALVALPMILVLGLVHASTAANTVEPSRAGSVFIPQIPGQLAPAGCHSQSLQVVLLQGSGRLRGTPLNDLLLGSASNDRIDGEEGDDCLVAGGGKNDRLYGGPGHDTCIGNDSTQFDGCEVIIVN